MSYRPRSDDESVDSRPAVGQIADALAGSDELSVEDVRLQLYHPEARGYRAGGVRDDECGGRGHVAGRVAARTR